MSVRSGKRASRATRLLALVFVLGLVAAACNDSSDGESTASEDATSADGSDDPQETATVRFAMQEGATGLLPHIAGENEGIFEEHGIEIEFVPASGFGSSLVALQVSGEVDVVNNGLSAVAAANQQGEDLKFFCSPTPFSGNLLVARADDDRFPTIEEAGGWEGVIESLEGATIGIPAPGGEIELRYQSVLREVGLDPESDVTFVGNGTGAPAVASLLEEQVDVQLGIGFASDAAISSGDLQVLMDFASDGPSFLPVMMHTGATALGSWLDENPEAARRYCDALQESIAFITDPANFDAVDQVLVDDYGLEDAALRRAAVENLQITGPELPEEGFDEVMGILTDAEVLEESPEVTHADLVWSEA